MRGLLLFIVLSIYSSTASTINSNDVGAPLVRIEIDPFELTLSPTSLPLSLIDESILRKEAEQAIRNVLTDRRGATFEYALLADIAENKFNSTRRLTVITKTRITFKGGIATFRPTKELPIPPLNELYGWIQTALEDNLIVQLSQTNELKYITNSSFHSLAPPIITLAPSVLQLPISYGGVSNAEQGTSHDETTNCTGRTVGFAVGAVLGLALLVLVVARQRRRRVTTTDKTSNTKMPENTDKQCIPDCEDNMVLETAPIPQHNDTVSLDSEWTLSTTAGASTVMIMPTESFERNRLYLKKDMLQADIFVPPASHDNNIPIFSSTHVSSKKKSKRPKNPVWNPSKADSFAAESNGKDNVYLVPPSQSSRKRSGSKDLPNDNPR